jgi:hypothetical protein
MLDAPKFVLNVLMVTCIHFSQCALNQVNGGWTILANTPRYEMENKLRKNVPEKITMIGSPNLRVSNICF